MNRIDYIFLESREPTSHSEPSEFTFFNMLWEDKISASQAKIISCGGNTTIAAKIKELLMTTNLSREDNIYIHFDMFNASLSSGLQHFKNIWQVLSEQPASTYWFRFHSFEHAVVETNVLDDVLYASPQTQRVTALLALLGKIHDCSQQKNYSCLWDTAFLYTSYPTLFSRREEVPATAERLIRACCSQASQYFYRRFVVEKTKLGHCWRSCISCGDKLKACTRVCLSDQPRSKVIMACLKSNTLQSLYTPAPHMLLTKASETHLFT